MKEKDRAWREIDVAALHANFDALRRASHAPRVCAVLKANAYGHGAAHLAPLYEKWGAAALAFATADEAMEARMAGVTLPIILLGHTDPAHALALAEAGIVPAVHSPASAQALSRAAQEAGVTLSVQIKVDTGMGRIGFVAREGEIARCADEILSAAAHPNLRAVGLFTHFSSADEDGVGIDYTNKQLSRFLAVRERLAAQGLALPAHAANSPTTLAYPDAHLDMVRPGLAFYGIDPFGDAHPAAARAPLTPALSVKARVAQVKAVRAGDAIGYGRTYIAPRDMRVATLAIGYADGIARVQATSGGGVEATPPQATNAPQKSPVFLPFVGRISMDQCAVDATAAPWLHEGDTVTVLGGRGPVSFAAAAAREGTIPYELLTRLSPRLPIFYENED